MPPRAAERLATRITELLGLPRAQLLAAFEDPLAELTAELRRPEGARPDDDEFDRSHVEQVETAAAAPAGWVLPLTTHGDWTSPAWRFRRGRLVLLNGSSPLGLRLPLDSVSWHDPEWTGEPSYLEAAPPLDPGIPIVTIVDPEGAQTTALTIEARDGVVHVFLPPTQELDAYADLLHVIERAATDAACPLVLEGYGPPPDARLRQLIVTPDPGVVEVNLQPTSTWAEQRDLTLSLYETARQVRLTTEKFDVDGTHTGTGGGNHITLGGAQPIESPLLRRPDLLPSLLTYWQRHPSLSYLFSGRFVGPTSQAPRFDEGRPEAVYEMEIALAEIRRLTDEANGGSLLPWVVDRSLRHLLTDLTGNTHRAEFCVDKLYSPDSSRGRLGLLELRGFEMPPHPELALVQALLVRSLVAMFWEKPLTAPLIRWGTGLHEDFLLPEGAIRDIGEVIADLRAHGIAFEETWLDAFTEFRFPRIGMTRVATGAGAGVELELRHAIEPWHVLGEEAGRSGTARYVDSSLQRLQVKVRGIDPERHLVTCNQVPVPLVPTGHLGEYYAGVRYRAWQPWSALHPMIPIHAPLTFDVIDTDAAAASAARRTTSCIPAAGRTSIRRSTRTRPKPGGPGASSRTVTHRVPSMWLRCARRPDARPLPTIPAHSTCGGSPTRDRAARLRDDPGPAAAVLRRRSSRATTRSSRPDGSLRPAWKGMAEAALGLTPEELKRVGGEISRFLADHGVTYVAARVGRPAVAARPDAARHGGRQLVAARDRARAAGRAAQRAAGRPVRRAVAPARRHPSVGRSCSGTPGTRALSRGPAPTTRSRCCCRRPTSVATPKASGTSSPIACRPLRVSATRWRTVA